MKKMLIIFWLFVGVHSGYAEETNILNNILYHHYVTLGKTNLISAGLVPDADFEIVSEGWAKSKWNLPYAKPTLATLHGKTTEANEWNRKGLRPVKLTQNESRMLYYLNQLITNSVNLTKAISEAEFRKQKRK